MMAGGQPMWVGQAPAFQVGPDGAVNLDQPITMPGPQFGGPPMMAPQAALPMYCGPDVCQPYPDPCACQPCPTPMMMMQPCPPPPPPLRWALFGDVLWLHPTGVDMAHAQQQDGLGGAGTVPFGEIGVVDPSYDLGIRIGGELRLAADAGVFVAFTFFEGDATSSLGAASDPGWRRSRRITRASSQCESSPHRLDRSTRITKSSSCWATSPTARFCGVIVPNM